jgi:hypothetical protein
VIEQDKLYNPLPDHSLRVGFVTFLVKMGLNDGRNAISPVERPEPNQLVFLFQALIGP